MDLFGTKSPLGFPPVPACRPEVTVPIDRIVERVAYYTDGGKDIVCFSKGTCAVLPDGLSDEGAGTSSMTTGTS